MFNANLIAQRHSDNSASSTFMSSSFTCLINIAIQSSIVCIHQHIKYLLIKGNP